MKRSEVVALLIKRVDKEFKTKRAAAAAIGVSDTHLNRALTGEFEIPQKVLDFLGFEVKTIRTYGKVKS